MRVRFSLCFCSLYFFMIASTSIYCPLGHRHRHCLKAFWRCERGQCVSILLKKKARDGIICQWLSNCDRNCLKSPGLSVLCFVLFCFFFFWIQVTIPVLSSSREHQLNSQSIIWVAQSIIWVAQSITWVTQSMGGESSGAILFKTHFFIPSRPGASKEDFFKFFKDFIRRDREHQFLQKYRWLSPKICNHFWTSAWRTVSNIRVMPRQQEVQNVSRDFHSLQTELPNLDFF